MNQDKIRIAVVDDDASFASALERWFRASGFEVSNERAEAVLLAAGYLMIITAAGLTPSLLAAIR